MSSHVEQLNEDNFETWKVQVRALLVRNHLWDYVNGTNKKPDTPPKTVEKWCSEDEEAKSEMILAMAPKDLCKIRDCNTSKDIWDKLNCLNSKSTDSSGKAFCLQTLMSLKIQNGETMSHHLDKFEALVDKARRMMIHIDEIHLVVILLNSLPPEYHSIRRFIESQDSGWDFATVKRKLLQEHQLMNTGRAVSLDMPLPVRGSDDMRLNQTARCYSCGSMGHKQRFCRRNQTAPTERASQPNTTFGFDNTNTCRWYLDTRSKSHVCADFTKFQDLSSDSLRMENTAERIRGVGTAAIKLSNKVFSLDNTQYVPDSNFNLVSVGKLTDLGYEVNFLRDVANIRDRNTGVTVMRASRFRNSYIVIELCGYPPFGPHPMPIRNLQNPGFMMNYGPMQMTPLPLAQFTNLPRHM